MENKTALDALAKAKKVTREKLDSMMNFSPVLKNKILVPDKFDALTDYLGNLYGYIQEETGVFTIIGWSENKPDDALKTICIGNIGGEPRYGVHGERSGSDIEYYFVDNDGNRKHLEKEVYSATQDLFSRNTGLLETSKMNEKTVLIVGCGSVGSIIALQLARSGVGRFILIDTDTVEIHNICRHQCNLTDIGRFKTTAVRDRIIAINPAARVITINNIIQNVTTKELDKYLDFNSIIVGCGDNRLSDAYSCELAYTRNIPFISIGFWKRAFACEIVVCIPQRGDTCYRCALQGAIERSFEVANQNRFYVGEEDRAKVAFEPGISVDIEFGTSIGTKMVLDALNLDEPTYISKVLHSLTQYTLVCNTNSVDVGGDDALMFSNPLQVVRNISFEKGKCMYCKT